MCSDSTFYLLNRLQMALFYFYATLAFIFLPFLNLGAQIKCLQNRYTDLKSALDQLLHVFATLSSLVREPSRHLPAQS